MSFRFVTHVPAEHPRKAQVEDAVRSAVVTALRGGGRSEIDLVLGDAPDYPSLVPAEQGISIRVLAGNCLRAGRIAPEASPGDIRQLVRQLVG